MEEAGGNAVSRSVSSYSTNLLRPIQAAMLGTLCRSCHGLLSGNLKSKTAVSPMANPNIANVVPQ